MFTRRILLLIVSFLILFGGCRAAVREQVELIASSSKATYASGERIEITITLKNTGNISTALSGFFDGNIRVISAKKDSVDVLTRITSIHYDEDLAFLLQQNLKSVDPGNSISISWKSANDRVLGGQALRTVQFQTVGDHQATFYLVGQPGTYQLSVVYKYPGPTGSFPQVFQRETNQADVKFTVTP